MKNISIIVAIAENNAIGKDNQLLWHIPNDLRHFKKTTTGHTIVMGSKTFNSMPFKPLPNRRSVVLTHQKEGNFAGCEVAHSVDEAIALMEEDRENFVIGGGSIYEQFLPFANKIYLTIVHQSFDAQVFFPDLDREEWKEETRTRVDDDPATSFSYSFITLIRK
ncbi:MAG: dihydrofolate reductase [Lentimicrobium sp.]|jgi:dihydrofolate reductase|nr:dihydrofolate reductase [Lentimicrobium sp.]